MPEGSEGRTTQQLLRAQIPGNVCHSATARRHGREDSAEALRVEVAGIGNAVPRQSEVI